MSAAPCTVVSPLSTTKCSAPSNDAPLVANTLAIAAALSSTLNSTFVWTSASSSPRSDTSSAFNATPSAAITGPSVTVTIDAPLKSEACVMISPAEPATSKLMSAAPKPERSASSATSISLNNTPSATLTVSVTNTCSTPLSTTTL